ncbi:MAG: hypothetical protein ABSH05_15755 [Bryobacteraceae bacterium]|jgi:hypothetical protein
MKAAVLTLIAIASAVPCVAQLPEEFRTLAGEYNGYYWKSLSFDEKVAFVYGFLAGYRFAAPTNKSIEEQTEKSCLAQFANPTAEQYTECVMKSLDAKTEEYKHWESLDPTPDGKYGETVEATDRFFAEPENRVMPVTVAWQIAKWKQEGRQQREIDELMDRSRRIFIRVPRTLCELGYGITASRCKTLGTTLKAAPPK